jgi:DNA phosphorothioation-dependent restriction protein DptH
MSDLLPAKSTMSIVVSSGGGTSDACNEGLATWCVRRFGNGEVPDQRQGVGPKVLEIYDTRPAISRPDHAMVSNLSEDTGNQVRWFTQQPPGAIPDLGIIAQLDSAQPEASVVGMRSPLGMGGLVRHRVRRQLHGAFLSESRQSLPRIPTGDVFADKVAACINILETGRDTGVGLQFAPNVHAVGHMLEDRRASFVAVSSSAIDPACFLGGWIKGTYLWDYDLPSYSHRAGDTSGYFLLSQVRDADRDALGRILRALPACGALDDGHIDQILLEVARRGIPTVRGLSGDDTGATGDLGLFLAVRLLQDQFRIAGNKSSMLPVMAGSADDASIALVIPVDPFRGYLADMTRSLGKDRRDATLSRPDLLVVGIRATADEIQLHITPIEVKCRHQGLVLGATEAREALGQAKALSGLLQAMQERAKVSAAWSVAYQHLLISMIGFGLRVYSQHQVVSGDPSRWAGYHERIAEAVLGPAPSVSIDTVGRLLVIDGTTDSGPRDHDSDGFFESIGISPADAGRIVGGDPQAFYDAVRAKVGDWRLMPGTSSAKDPKNSDAPCEEPATSGAKAGTSGEMAVDEARPRPTDPVFPTAPGESPISSRAAAPTEPTASGCRGIVLSVGRSVDGFEPRQLSLNISDTRLNQLNIGVVGDLGTGKTQLLKSLIAQVSRSQEDNRGVKPRFLIFDYKRDYSSPEFVEATGARVVKPARLPFNLFDTTTIGESMAPWLDRFRFFADVLDKVYSGIGPVQRDKLKSAVRSAYETCLAQGRQPTIYDIHAEYKSILAGKSDSPMAIIDDLVDMEVFEKDPSKTKPFDDFLNGIVVVSLDAMGQDDRSKNMLVAVMLNMFYENMLKTPKRPFIGTDPQLRVIDSYLLVDEADNIMRYEFDVLRKLLLQGREFGAGVILASQYLRHFKASATDYKEPLLTWFIHKVPNVTPAELGALGFTSDLGDLSERVKTLPNHHCLYKSFDSSGEVIRGLPFYELGMKP